MAKKPKRVYSAALGRMVSVDEGSPESVRRPPTIRQPGERVYSDGADVDRLSITQQVIEHPEVYQKRLEDAKTAKYEELLHSIYDAVLITDMEGNVFEINARAEFVFKWEQDELNNINIVDIISGADSELMKVIRKNVGNKKYTVLEAICIRGDNSRFNADIVVNRLKSRAENALCFFIRDVTVRKQAEEDLRRANDMLLEAERVQARIDTISTLLHGFNNPLQILTCMAEIDENEEYKKQLDRIMALLDQLRQEQSLDEIVGEDGSSRYDVDEQRELIAADHDRILVVDDEVTLRGIFVDALTSSFPGKTIDPAGDGKAALDLFSMRHHGIVIMDVSMPVMTGEQAFIEMEQLCANKGWQMPCVIFCTGFVISDDLKELVGDGKMHACLQKPLSLSSLIGAVKARIHA